MKKIIILSLTLMLAAPEMSLWSQKSKSKEKEAVPVDEKKMAKAQELISKAIAEKKKDKQGEMLQKATEIFREMKMAQEGAIMIGDAFYNEGDLQTASRWYAKGGKDTKKDLNQKVGEAYLAEAIKGSDDPKLDKKNLQKAIQTLTKAHGASEAYRMVGNEYFDMGKEFYPQAIEYYKKAGYTEGITMIADIYAAKEETRDQAAELYASSNNEKGFKKAGDLYYNAGNYMKAMEYYQKGEVTDGYLKFANELKKAGKIDDMNKVYLTTADILIKKGKPDDIYDFALMAEKDNNFVLASELYKKLNNQEMYLKYKAKVQMRELKYIEAKNTFTEMGRPSMVEAIDKNIKHLTDLDQLKQVLDELKRNVPKLAIREDPNTGKQEYDKRDIKLREQYYSNPAVANEISSTVYKIGAIASKVSSAELKEALQDCFWQYNPVKNLLETNFSKKISEKNVVTNMLVFEN